MSGVRGVTDRALVCRLENAATRAWPATITRAAAGGWLLRATPGLDRARSNNALAPCRELGSEEIAPAIERVREFAREHEIAPGIQVSPLELHDGLQQALDKRGWTTGWPTVVVAGPMPEPPPSAALSVGDHASGEWLRAWGRCEPGRDVAAHAATVFELLRGRACFAQIGSEAVGIAVRHDGLVGMFCVAVDPDRRRSGLGTQLVRGMLAEPRVRGDLAYLQVEEGNVAARAMYERLGFVEIYRYCHRRAGV